MRQIISRCFLLIISGLLLASFYAAHGCGGSSTALTATFDASARANNKIYTTDPVSVTFSQTMNQESVEAAFTITGSDPVAGTFAWTDNTVTFTRESGLWKTHHPYTITITSDAKTIAGAPLPNFEQTFTPGINMHDVNGDGIDDFMLASPFHTFNGNTNAGIAYLFLGKSEWSDIDLATATADATFGFEQQDARLGLDARVVGDINGDGYADMAISAASGPPALIIIIYGSAEPTSITLTDIDDTIPASFDTLSQLSGIALGTADVTLLGFPITPAGDVNGDGLGDFVVTGRYAPAPDENTRHWLVLGRTEAFPPHTTDLTTMPTVDTISNAKYTVFGDPILVGMYGYPIAACDINGDELDDLVFGSPTSEVGGIAGVGKTFIVAGSESPTDRDLITGTADQTILGEGTMNALGSGIGCGDVNGDGYGDILIGAAGYNQFTGRTYLIAGAETFTDVNLSATPALATYTGRQSSGAAGARFGANDTVLGDVNGDGIDDYIFGAPTTMVDGSDFRGQAFLFLGSESPTNVDLGADGTASATYSGPIPPNSSTPGNISFLGVSKSIGDVNGDGLNDILVVAPAASEGGVLERGIIYIMFGSETPSSLDFASDSPNVKILGAAADDKLSIILPIM